MASPPKACLINAAELIPSQSSLCEIQIVLVLDVFAVFAFAVFAFAVFAFAVFAFAVFAFAVFAFAVSSCP
jgi:hypothetical protein